MRVDVISNNIANMSTSAYRPRVAEFSDLVYQQYLTPGTLTSQLGTTVPAGIQLGTGVKASTVSMEITQGSMRQSGGELDIGIGNAGGLLLSGILVGFLRANRPTFGRMPAAARFACRWAARPPPPMRAASLRRLGSGLLDRPTPRRPALVLGVTAA